MDRNRSTVGDSDGHSYSYCQVGVKSGTVTAESLLAVATERRTGVRA